MLKTNTYFAVVILCFGCGDSGGTSGTGGGSTTGTGGSASTGTVQCEIESCDECCLNSVCDTAQACGNYAMGGSVLYCDGPEDCSNGDTCCAGIPGGGSFPIIAECTAPAECSMIGVGVYYFCHSDEDCGNLGTCAPWEFGSYVSVCGQ